MDVSHWQAVTGRVPRNGLAGLMMEVKTWLRLFFPRPGSAKVGLPREEWKMDDGALFVGPRSCSSPQLHELIQTRFDDWSQIHLLLPAAEPAFSSHKTLTDSNSPA